MPNNDAEIFFLRLEAAMRRPEDPGRLKNARFVPFSPDTIARSREPQTGTTENIAERRAGHPAL
jgi:hypothetical protein